MPERHIPAPPPPQLFDLVDDPLEERDLAPTQPARVAAMDAAIGAWFEDVELDRRQLGPRD